MCIHKTNGNAFYTLCHGNKVVSHTPGYQIYLSHFRMFAPKCAACQMPIAPQPVSCSAVVADEGVGGLVRVDEEG